MFLQCDTLLACLMKQAAKSEKNCSEQSFAFLFSSLSHCYYNSSLFLSIHRHDYFSSFVFNLDFSVIGKRGIYSVESPLQHSLKAEQHYNICKTGSIN